MTELENKPSFTEKANEPSVDALIAALEGQKPAEPAVETPPAQPPAPETPPAQPESTPTTPVAENTPAPVVTPTGLEQPPTDPDDLIFGQRKAPEEPVIDYKAEFEKTKAALEAYEKDKFTNDLRTALSDPNFDIKAWAKEVVGDDASRYSPEQLFLMKEDEKTGRPLTDEEKTEALEEFNSMSQRQKDAIANEMRKQLEAKNTPVEDFVTKTAKEVREAQQAQIDYYTNVTNKINELAPAYLGKKIAGYIVDEKNVSQALDSIMNPNYYLNEKGEYDIEKRMLDAFKLATYDQVVGKTAQTAETKGKAEIVKAVTNPSLNTGGNPPPPSTATSDLDKLDADRAERRNKFSN